jgi:TRAP-type C4-dicarboxylate transport system permease large subunit/uncharacterized membrane protein
MEAILIAILLLIFAFFRTPLFIIIAALTVYLFYVADENLASIIVSLTELSRQSILLTIPLFTFAGYLLSESKTPERLIRLSKELLGFLPGGLAIVTVITTALFTAFTGASGVTIIALGGLLYPILIQQQYPEKFSLGLMTTSGSLGLLFPPSLPIILYGIVSKTDISELFRGALLPGILLVGILAVYAVRTGIVEKIEKNVHPLEDFSQIKKRFFKVENIKSVLFFIFFLVLPQFLKDFDSFFSFLAHIAATYFGIKSFFLLFLKEKVIEAFLAAKYEVVLPLFIVYGIYSGQFTATESAAVTAFYVFIMEVFIYKDLSIKKDLIRISKDSMILVGAILIIMGFALAFTNYLIDEEIPDLFLDSMKQFIDSKIGFLIVLNIFLLIVGAIMDIYSAILVVVPLIVPLAAEFNVHPVHLGVIFLTNLEIGYMTPPVGLNLFISSFRFDKDILLLYRSALPFIALLLVALALITYFPSLSLWMVS